MTKSTKERKRKFQFQTPSKQASPFLYTKKQRHTEERSRNDTTPVKKSTSNDFVVKTPVRRIQSEAEGRIRQNLASNHDQRRLQMFDTLCMVMHKKIQQTAATAHAKDICTKKQLLHVLEAAATIVKNEFAAPQVETLPKPQHDTVHTIISTLEDKLAGLEQCEREWQIFHENVPAALRQDLQQVTTPLVDTINFECNSIPNELAKEQNELKSQVHSMKTKMHFLDSNLNEVERMIHVSQAMRSSLFDSFHASEFKGYNHIQSPKAAVKALMALFS